MAAPLIHCEKQQVTRFGGEAEISSIVDHRLLFYLGVRIGDVVRVPPRLGLDCEFPQIQDNVSENDGWHTYCVKQAGR